MNNKADNQNFLIRLAQDNPLATVMIAAIIFRLLATIFSKGYLYTDDHYETVSVAYKWLQNGLLNSDGYLTWGGRTDPDTIRRCPIYTLFLFGIMKFLYAFGVESLDKLMYGVRAVHSLISLVSVYAVYKTVELVTKSSRWALIGGLFIALHFALPTLSARTLIEFVSANFWILAIYLTYKYQYKRQALPVLCWAGIFSAVAILIRFQVVFSVILVPIILIWQYKRIKEALWFCYGMAAVLIITGILEYQLLDSFLKGTLSQLPSFSDIQSAPPVHEPFWVYIVVLIVLFIPPLSIFTFISAGFKKFWSRHPQLVFTTLSFVLLHTILWNRQERFIIPILPAVILIMTLVVWQQYSQNGFLFRHKRLFKAMVIFSIVINLFMLPIFTMNYGRKGLVDPLVKIEKISERPAVIYFSPEKFHEMYPDDYVGLKGSRRYNITSWESLNTHIEIKKIDTIESFLVIYPLKDGDMQRYLDSLETRLGPLEELYHIGPSTIDYVLHILNPRHNRTHEAWVYKHNVEID